MRMSHTLPFQALFWVTHITLFSSNKSAFNSRTLSVSWSLLPVCASEVTCRYSSCPFLCALGWCCACNGGLIPRPLPKFIYHQYLAAAFFVHGCEIKRMQRLNMINNIKVTDAYSVGHHHTCSRTQIFWATADRYQCSSTPSSGKHSAVHSKGETATGWPCGHHDLIQPHLPAGEGGWWTVHLRTGPVSGYKATAGDILHNCKSCMKVLAS